jgi:hypothetical protein
MKNKPFYSLQAICILLLLTASLQQSSADDQDTANTHERVIRITGSS